MGVRKSGLDIEKEILLLLNEKERSLREIETRLNTNYNTVRAHCKVLEYFGMVESVRHKKNDVNGRPYTTVRITLRGRDVLRERGELARRRA